MCLLGIAVLRSEMHWFQLYRMVELFAELHTFRFSAGGRVVSELALRVRNRIPCA